MAFVDHVSSTELVVVVLHCRCHTLSQQRKHPMPRLHVSSSFIESNSQRLNKIIQSKERKPNTKTINTLEKNNYEV